MKPTFFEGERPKMNRCLYTKTVEFYLVSILPSVYYHTYNKECFEEIAND